MNRERYDQVSGFSGNSSADVNLTLALGISNELATHHRSNEKMENDLLPFKLDFNVPNTQDTRHYERGSENATTYMDMNCISEENYGLSNNYGSFNILNAELPQHYQVASFDNFSGHQGLLPTTHHGARPQDHISWNHFGNKNSSVIGDQRQFPIHPNNISFNNFESLQSPPTPKLQNNIILPNSSSREGSSRRHGVIYNDPNRRCVKCNGNNTPMWRKGPLGPMSLCNACGIKYRKGKGKKTEEASANEQ